MPAIRSYGWIRRGLRSVTSAPEPEPEVDALLLEDGTQILLEDGTPIELEDA